MRINRRINPVSDKQSAFNHGWREIVEQKAIEQDFVCQWCHRPGQLLDGFNPLEGHHMIKRRYGMNTPENCFICHRLCHQWIEEHNIRPENLAGGICMAAAKLSLDRIKPPVMR